MFNLDWLYNQQDFLCSLPMGEKKKYPVSDYSGFIPDPAKDPYFVIRKAIWPNLHTKNYPHIPV